MPVVFDQALKIDIDVSRELDHRRRLKGIVPQPAYPKATADEARRPFAAKKRNHHKTARHKPTTGMTAAGATGSAHDGSGTC
jgi:hypothetical protein